ncbi:glycosyltransferase family 39 protein [Candidatus Chloroploca sp. Khr17]|uniref:ArnT family glycosyltransferase n=1 Tax=Candidatus Chloroploca sp. Khr17 TaxID=2496869 RepID=UPI00101CE491|nr:glycosyltransferase family 39 protein [Candidatus Chloroploca sp. Khr17]
MSKTLTAHAASSPRLKLLAQRWEQIALVALVILVLFLAFVNLPYAPRTWFDEGSHLHVPKTLVNYGVYADISSEGFRYFGPTIGVGPTVMLPVALAFQLGGVGLVQARLVIVLYMAIALLALFLLARRLHGLRIALLTLVLILASRTLRFEGMVEYGRQVLGEVPGIAFLSLGLLAYVQGILRPAHATRYALLAGAAFGLALVTKNQFVLIVPPTLALLALLDWRYFRVGNWWLRLAPPAMAVAAFGAWMVIMLTFFGPDGFAANYAKTRQAAGGAIFVFEFEASRRAVVYLIQVYGGLLIPGLLYSLWRCRQRTPQALAELAPTLMACLWIAWFVVSLGWARYAFPAVILGSLAVARLAADTIQMLHARRLTWPTRAAVAYLGLIILIPLSLTIRTLLSPDDSTHRMAAYLNANIPQNIVIETWEPEIGVLSDHRFHYVPTELLDPAVRHVWSGGPPVVYDGLDAQPQYVLAGPFSAYTQIYPLEILQRDYTVRFVAEPYVLLERTIP